jgi:hypothetical protein
MEPLRRANHLSRWALPIVVRRCVWSRNLKNGGGGMTRVGSQRHSIKKNLNGAKSPRKYSSFEVVKKFSNSIKTQKSLVFMNAHHWSPSWARQITATISNPFVFQTCLTLRWLIYIYIYIYIYDTSSLMVNDLTLILLTWRKSWANNASK